MNLDSRILILGLAVTLLGTTLTCTLIQASDKTSPFYVAASDLPRGHILVEGDLTTAQVKLDDELAALAWTAADAEPGADAAADSEDAAVAAVAGGAPLGALIVEPLRAGELLFRSSVGAVAPLRPGEAAVTLPVIDDATWRAVVVGDHLRIWISGRITNASGQEGIFAEPLVVRARVLATRVQEDLRRINVTLAVPDEPAVFDRLAAGLIVGLRSVYRLSPDATADDSLFRELLAEGTALSPIPGRAP